VLIYVEGRLRDNNPPSQREIAQHFGLTQNAAFQLLKYLKNKGYLTDLQGHRTLRLSQEYIDSKGLVKGIPLVGRATASKFPIVSVDIFHPSQLCVVLF